MNRTMTYDEWFAEGKRRFGPDMIKWRFQCPICKHVAAVEDFRPYISKGAKPGSATCECIGRYNELRAAMISNGPDGPYPRRELKGPCDYAGYGLFRLSPIEVVMPDKTTIDCFDFAEPEKTAESYPG